MRLPAALSRRALLYTATIAALPPLPLRAADLAAIPVTENIAFSVPPSYYRPRSRPPAGTYDDTLFVAADYAAGRTASVSRTTCQALLTDAGDPLPLIAGQITSLSDIGKPTTIARLLAARRDGDPQQAQFARSEVRDVVKDGDNTLSFTLLTLATSATSMTTAMPRVRKTQARTMFVGGSTPYLVTAWASSASPGASCVETDCPPCTQLRCGCPPPKCEDTTGPDPVDLAIVGSLRVA